MPEPGPGQRLAQGRDKVVVGHVCVCVSSRFDRMPLPTPVLAGLGNLRGETGEDTTCPRRESSRHADPHPSQPKVVVRGVPARDPPRTARARARCEIGTCPSWAAKARAVGDHVAGGASTRDARPPASHRCRAIRCCHSACPSARKREPGRTQSHGTIERPWGSEPESLTSSSASWRGGL